MANIFSNPWDEERQRKLRSPFTGVRPYQPSLPPGGAHGQIWDGNTGMGLMPGPSTPPGGPAPLPPGMQTPSPRDPNNEYWTQDRLDKIGPILDHTGNPAPHQMRPKVGDPVTTPMPTMPVYGGQNPPRLPDMPEGYGPTTTDVVHYINTETGEKRSGPSSGYGGLGNLGPPWQMDDSMHTLIQQPKQGPPNTKFSPNPNPPGYITPLPSPPRTQQPVIGPGPIEDGGIIPGTPGYGGPNPNPPGYITPLPSPPNAGTGGPLPPYGPNRPSRPTDPGRGSIPGSGWRLEADPSLLPPGLPPIVDNNPVTGIVPLQGQGYNRATTSSSSPSPAWGVGKTKRKF